MTSVAEEDAAAREVIAALDLGDYVVAMIVRRLRRRMEILDIADLSTYRDHVRGSAAERDSLRAFLPISTTAFFRDTSRWDALATSFVPALLARKDHVRIWSAGCSTGEEAYTLAMLFCEQTGIAELARRVEIFATDTSTTNLDTARAGRYGARSTAVLGAPMSEKYLPDGTVTPALRSVVRFTRHDVLNDPPWMRIDLVVCRNTLLYMRREAQGHALAKLHVSLADDGVLFCGPADGLALHGHLFRRTDNQLYNARPDAKRTALLAACARRG